MKLRNQAGPASINFLWGDRGSLLGAILNQTSQLYAISESSFHNEST